MFHAKSPAYRLRENSTYRLIYLKGGLPYQTKEQKDDIEHCCGHIKNYNLLDYVCGWYVKAHQYMTYHKTIQTAFVSTNSITQGEQVDVLWKPLIDDGICINFAHQTFKWSNEGKGVAAVHCIIVGFSFYKKDKSSLYSYTTDEDYFISHVKNINPYLLNAPNITIKKSNTQMCGENDICFGSMPNDGGNLLLSESEKDSLLQFNNTIQSVIKKFVGAEEFLNGKARYCLWFNDINPIEVEKIIKMNPLIKQRIQNTKLHRSESNREATKKLANTPHLFGEIRQPTKGNYLIIPSVSSENRKYVPIGFLDYQTITSNLAFTLPNATLYHFGMLNSTMHNAWMRTVAGRLESRYRYSNTIVYNNFPFPFHASEREESNATPEIKKAVTNIEAKAQAVLDARAKYENEAIAKGENPPSLADLYRVGLIDAYPELTKAHKALDKAVDAAYGYTGKGDDSSRVAFLFERYEALTKAIAEEEAAKKKTKKTKAKAN